MSITWTMDNDSRAMLGPSATVLQATASFSASDYVTGGYPVLPSAFGLGSIRCMLEAGSTSNAVGYPGGYEWNPVAPSVAGPAASYPWYLQALRQNGTTGPLVETESNTDFSGGTLRVLVFGLG
jgi:hypothetical protein